jgi:lactate dehydrogenase-like 2-hydroxyacid dehydrogenase
VGFSSTSERAGLLVNTARAAIVYEDAMIGALESGRP